MRLLPALLVFLASASLAAAGTDVVFEEEMREGITSQTVSWTVPEIFDESELLLAVEGGPRVRLTRELSERNPRVTVVLPALQGKARFVVRAGRKANGADPGLPEQDIGGSNAFALRPARSGSIPVKAAATRPEPGLAMEWWADPSGRPLEGPATGLDHRGTMEPGLPGSGGSILPSTRPELRRPGCECPDDAKGGEEKWQMPVLPDVTSAFAGAATPLRN
ncbi:MAG: hypothetical protein IT186_18175 [Acidobacteria bacterium]|nr:hypothetical protein [Acidobacteriota bacterium]